jgi:uncharacterized membrane protein
MKNIILLIVGVVVVIATFAFQLLKAILMVILGIVGIAAGKTKESLAKDLINEKADIDRIKNRVSRPETAYDQLEDLTIQMYRNYAKQKGVAPSSKMYDHEILEIVKFVQTAFMDAAKRKGEHISGTYLMTINVYFLQQYETFGKEFFIKHLEYEVNKYITEGLRSSYQKDLGLI